MIRSMISAPPIRRLEKWPCDCERFARAGKFAAASAACPASEVSNTTPLPARIYAGEGIAQMLFFQSDEPCEVSYADKKGKYQGQTQLTLPRL